LILLVPTIAFADSCPNSITICGCTLDSGGTTYTLANDISISGSNTCLEISLDSIRLDGNNHKISGDGSTGSIGINIKNQVIRVFNLNITGFSDGIKYDTGTLQSSRIFNNHIYGNTVGIHLLRDTAGGDLACSEIKIYNNIINNNNFGLRLFDCSGNYIYNNFFNNSINAKDDGSNYYDSGKSPGTNIISGPWIGGNYWNDYTGIDNSIPLDGIGDTKLPYNSNGNIVNGGDNLPLVDINPPQHSNNQTHSPVNYDNVNSNFTITWNDNVAFSTALLENNFTGSLTNTTMQGTFPNYYYNITLGAGTYQVRFIGNDTSNNQNATDIKYFTINKASNQVNLYLNGTLNSNKTYTYPQAINATGTSSVLTPSLYRDEVSKGTNEQILLGTGNYAYKVNATGNANYSDNSTGITFYALVNKATPSLSLTSSKSINYGTVAGMTGSTSDTGNGGCTYNLYRSGSSYGSGTSVTDNTVLGVGSYPYVYNTSGCTNYTSGTTTINTLTVNQASTTATLYLNGSTSSQNSVYPNSTINATATSSVSGLYVQIWRNNNLIANTTNTATNTSQWGAYNNNFTAKVLGNQNYSDSASVMLWWNVSKASASCSLTGVTNHVYGTSDIISCSCTGDGTTHLYRNETLRDEWNNVPVKYDAGTYNWVCNITEGNNYNSASTSQPQIISQAIPSLSASVTSPINYSTASGYSASESNTGDNYCTYILLRNGFQIATGSSVSDNTILGVGMWNYTYYTTGCSNYTSNKDEKLLTVNKASRTCTLATDKGWTRTYDGTASSTTCSVSAGSSDGTMAFTKNSNPVSSPDSQTNAGAFNYACQWTGGVNYSDCTQQTNTLTISRASASCSLTSSASWTYTYPTTTTLICGCTGDGTTNLYFNGVQHNDYNNSAKVYSANLSGHSVICNITQGTNYNAASSSNNLIINKATPSGSLTVNPSWTVTYPTSVTIGYSESNSVDADVTYKVWRDGVDKGSGETWTPPTGTYQYKLNTTGGTNFTARDNMDTKTLIVGTKPAANCSLTSSSGWSYTYGTSTTLACSCKGDGTTNLYFNGALHNDYNNSARIFAANPSGYSVVCNITEGTNYASAMNSSTLTISKTTPSININILPSETVSYPTQTTASCSISSINNEVTPRLFRNGISVSNPEIITLPVGNYLYVCNNTGTQNYTTGQAQKTLVVSSVSVPVITILSPGSTYYTTSIPLTFTVSKPPSWCGYSLDGTANKTITGCANTTLTGLSYSTHNIIVYANDTSGNMGASSRVYFTVIKIGGGCGRNCLMM